MYVYIYLKFSICFDSLMIHPTMDSSIVVGVFLKAGPSASTVDA